MQLPYRQTSARGASTSRGRLQFSVHSNDGGLSRLQPVSISTQIVPLFSQVYLFNAIAIQATSARGASTPRGRLQFSVHSNDGGLSRLQPVSISTQDSSTV